MAILTAVLNWKVAGSIIPRGKNKQGHIPFFLTRNEQLTVSWNANQEPVDGYKVYWGTESGNYTNSADVGKTLTYTITGLTNGVPYYIAIKAYVDLRETYYYHTDHLGTPIMMTDKNQNVVWQMERLPFGELQSLAGTTSDSIGFPGQYYDTETGLYYNWYRYYKADIGRYIEFDPLLHPANVLPQCCGCSKYQNISILPVESLLVTSQSLNPYVYVQNRPDILIDPTGLGPPRECYSYTIYCLAGDPYACGAQVICYTAGNNQDSNCIRNCLLSLYQFMQSPAETLKEHGYCYVECLCK